MYCLCCPLLEAKRDLNLLRLHVIIHVSDFYIKSRSRDRSPNLRLDVCDGRELSDLISHSSCCVELIYVLDVWLLVGLSYSIPEAICCLSDDDGEDHDARP